MIIQRSFNIETGDFEFSVTHPASNQKLLLRTHERNEDCTTFGCTIHNRNPHAVENAPGAEWSYVWRTDRGIMERICPEHHIAHPDPDQINYWNRTLPANQAHAESIHGCCGECSGGTVHRIQEAS